MLRASLSAATAVLTGGFQKVANPRRQEIDVGKQKGRGFRALRFSLVRLAYIMPPMPPMPPPPGMAGAGSFGSSATMASVVTRRPATEPASCSAVRTTLAGSTMPASIMSTYFSFWASKPKVSDFSSMILPTTIEPSTPAFSAIWRIGASSALSTMLMPACTSGCRR